MCPEKVNHLKDFATICVNLHQIKYIFTHTHTHTATWISNDVLKFLDHKLLDRLINQILITQKLDHTAQLLSTLKVITISTFKVDVESVLRSHGYTFTVASATD